MSHPNDERHKQFQFGTNPMDMTPFEKACVMKEEMERALAREGYILGIQGRDGGHRYAPKSEYEKK